MTDLATITNAKLAKLLTSAYADVTDTQDAAYAHAVNGDERLRAITTRLGPDHPAVIALHATWDVRATYETEATLRLGPCHTNPVTLLENSPRYRRVKA